MPKITNPWIAALYAALYSWGISIFTILSTMVAVGFTLGVGTPQRPAGGFDDWPTFVTFMSHAWFAGVIGLVFQLGPYARAKQGFTAATSGTLPPPEQNQPRSS